MYTIQFLNYNYFSENICLECHNILHFNSFIKLLEFTKKNKMYEISDEYMIMCGKRYINLPMPYSL